MFFQQKKAGETMNDIIESNYDKNTKIQKFKVADNYINLFTYGYLDKKRKMNKLDNIIYL